MYGDSWVRGLKQSEGSDLELEVKSRRERALWEHTSVQDDGAQLMTSCPHTLVKKSQLFREGTPLPVETLHRMLPCPGILTYGPLASLPSKGNGLNGNKASPMRLYRPKV